MPGYPKNVTEKTALKREAKELRKRIKQAQSLLQQREQIKSLKLKLVDLEYEIKNPGDTRFR